MSEKRSRSASPKRKESESKDYDQYGYYIVIVYGEYDKHEQDATDMYFANKGELSLKEVEMLMNWSKSSNYQQDYLSGYDKGKPKLPKNKPKLRGQPTTLEELREHRLLQERFAVTLMTHCYNCNCTRRLLRCIDMRGNSMFSDIPMAIIRLRAGERPETFLPEPFEE